MCFYDSGDYDWYANYSESDTVPAPKRVRCMECGNVINKGESCLQDYLQEHDYCVHCGEEGVSGDAPGVIGELPVCPNAESEGGPCCFGETSVDYTCMKCVKFLQAIEAQEEAEGCPEYSRRPQRGKLREELWEVRDADPYFDRARAMFPEIAAGDYLDELYEGTRNWARELDDWDDDADPWPADEYDELFITHGGECG